MFKTILMTLIFCQATYAHKADHNVVKKNITKLGLASELRAIGNISRKEAAKLKLEFFSSENKKKKVSLKLKETPEVSLWMEMKSGMGHGSEKLEIKQSGNAYIISNAWFMMMGDWQLKVKLTHKDKTSLEIYPICVGRKPVDSYVGKCK